MSLLEHLTQIPHEPGKGRIYFLIEDGGERIKIGKTINLAIRMRDLGRLSARPLYLACLIEGYTGVERFLHGLFAPWRVLDDQGKHHGEWFHLSPEIVEAVEAILDHKTNAVICADDRASAQPQEVAHVPEREDVPPPIPEFDEEDYLAEQARKVAELEALQLKISKRKCREKLSEFCKAAWRALHPTTALEWNWHHDALCDHLQWAFEGWMRTQGDPTYKIDTRWMVFNIPPGTLKTEIIMVFAPAWMWMRWPGWRVLCLSSNPKVALDSAVLSRRVITSSWYQDTFQPDWTLSDDQNAKGNFGNSAGGARMSHGMTAAVVGEHADCILLDDPNDPKDMNSKANREEVGRAWDDAIQNRVTDERTCLRIAIQQRVDVDDWTGHVTRKPGNKWLQVRLPMEFEADRRCVSRMPVNANGRLELDSSKVVGTWQDPRTKEGEVLHPRRFPPEVLDQKRADHGPYGYACQYQQRPGLREGGMVKKSFWRFARLGGYTAGDRRRPPECVQPDVSPTFEIKAKKYGRGWELDFMEISIDAANKKTERGSQYGIFVGAGKDNRRFILDDKTRRGDFLEILQIIRDLITFWRPNALLIEDKAAGPQIISTLREEIATGKLKDPETGDSIILVIEPLEPDGDKTARMEAVLPTLAANLVYLLEGAEWVDDWVDELGNFPQGATDRGDALSQFLAKHRMGDYASLIAQLKF